VHFILGARRDAETAGRSARTSAMERRDIIMVLAVLLLTVAATWAGTDYVVNQVVLPLVEDQPAPSPGFPSP
jgi:hypothetical protein